MFLSLVESIGVIKKAKEILMTEILILVLLYFHGFMGYYQRHM